MTSMNKNIAKKMSDRIKEVLEAEFPDYDYIYKGGTYSETAFDVKMTFRVPGSKTQIEKMGEQVAASRGIKLENSKYQIKGYNSRASKFPWIYLKKSDGKKYKCTDTHVESLMNE